jgi:hypothetical protein
MADNLEYEDRSADVGTSITLDEYEKKSGDTIQTEPESKLPPAMLKISPEKLTEFTIFCDQWMAELMMQQANLQSQWAEWEKLYRAKPGGAKSFPFTGASNEIVPVAAMAVDPIHARLETGIFKQDPVFKIKPLTRALSGKTTALEQWVDFYQRHRLNLRQVANPRLLELAKLGTCVFKTVYDREVTRVKTYDMKQDWKVIEKEVTTFQGPRVFGVSLGDFLFPASYQFLQDCPFVAERQRTTLNNLLVAQKSGKLTNVDKISAYLTKERTSLEDAREVASNHSGSIKQTDELVVYEIWCDFDIDGDGLPEKIVATYHYACREFLQIRYNWYFHQRKPYTVIPYTVTNDSLYGIGVCEMTAPFQDALTRWQQMASDNAYIANIRMFIAKRDSGIEDVPRLYAGRVFFVDDPRSDFIPFAAGDIYPSTLSERQNIFGLVEKRTGVSDYLTGRESPIIGTRATATSTLALIQEGTKRVEEVLENIRCGFSEIIQRCFEIWIQYGTEDLTQLVFGSDEIAQIVEEFFQNATQENVNGAMAIDLSATDASGNRQVMQQMQLQIIQIMMQYLEKLLQAGQMGIQAQKQMPQLAEMISDVMNAARNMFKELLQKYDIRNPEDYLPDLSRYLNVGPGGVPAPGGQGIATSGQGPASGSAGLGGISATAAIPAGPAVPAPAIPGSGTGILQALQAAGASGGSQGVNQSGF